RFVDGLIRGEIAGAITAGVMRQHLVVARANLVDRIAGDPGTGQLAGEPFAGSHHRKQLRDVLAGDLGHAPAPMGKQHDEAPGGEDLQRLAQRRTRDPEQLTELFLGDLAARLEPALRDEITDARHGLVVERRFHDLHRSNLVRLPRPWSGSSLTPASVTILHAKNKWTIPDKVLV